MSQRLRPQMAQMAQMEDNKPPPAKRTVVVGCAIPFPKICVIRAICG